EVGRVAGSEELAVVEDERAGREVAAVDSDPGRARSAGAHAAGVEEDLMMLVVRAAVHPGMARGLRRADGLGGAAVGPGLAAVRREAEAGDARDGRRRAGTVGGRAAEALEVVPA